MSELILSADELQTLTRRARPSWQARELDFLKIPYRRRSDGSVIVLREDLRTEHASPAPRRREPQLRLS